jgi:hypothetical protein
MIWTTRIFLCSIIFCTLLHAQEHWVFLDNGHVRIGINKDAGGSVGWFSKSRSGENLLNSFDHGRYVQQSYYGDADGSDWNGQAWRYNPVQGGSWKGVPSEIKAQEEKPQSLYTKTRPRQWASGEWVDDMVMEQWITLDSGLARLKYRMTYSGTLEHKPRHQELPAVFVNPRFDTLIFVEKDSEQLVKKQPGKKNEYFHTKEPWAAWVDASQQGVGVFFPHAKFLTAYRVRDSGIGDVSYLSPLQTFSLKPKLVFEYETVLAIGSLEQIRSVFATLQKQQATKP